MRVHRIRSSDRTVSDMIHAVSLSGSSIQIAKNESRPLSTVILYPLLTKSGSPSKDGLGAFTLALRVTS